MTGVLPRWCVALPTRHVVVAELVAGALVVMSATWPWWTALITTVGVFSVAATCYRGATAAGWLKLVARLRNNPASIPPAVNVELAGVGQVGVRWDGNYTITMIALHGRPYPETTLVPDGADTLDTVPLEAVAALMRQFGGLQLHSIDVVSTGSRIASSGRFTPRYDAVVGDRAAVGERRTWVTLRLCPQACLKALAYRGDVGVAVAAATERIRQAAVKNGCRASVCNADQLDAATQSLLGDESIDRHQQRWTHVRAGNDYVTSYRIAGADLTSRLLADLWTIRSNRTVVTLRLTTGPGGSIDAAALLRLHTSAPLIHPPMATLHTVAGQQCSALWASLPLGNRSLALSLSPRPLEAAGRRLVDRGGLLVPVGPSGLMLGMSLDGVPLLVPFTDPLKHTRIALIRADIDVVQSLLLRAVASGHNALIHTDRPELWQPICDERLMLADDGAEPTDLPTLMVADGELELKRLLAAGGRHGHALVAITDTPIPDCDIAITQVAAGEIVVDAGGRAPISLTLMRPRNETQFLMRRTSA